MDPAPLQPEVGFQAIVPINEGVFMEAVPYEGEPEGEIMEAVPLENEPVEAPEEPVEPVEEPKEPSEPVEEPEEPVEIIEDNSLPPIVGAPEPEIMEIEPLPDKPTNSAITATKPDRKNRRKILRCFPVYKK